MKTIAPLYDRLIGLGTTRHPRFDEALGELCSAYTQAALALPARKRQRTAAQWAAIVAEWLATKERLIDFCARHGISNTALRVHVRRLASSGDTKG
jgi:hypothetical protein